MASAVEAIMKKIYRLITLLVLLFSLLPSGSAMAQEPNPGEEPASGAVVCAPDVYLSAPDDCLPLGPSTYITEMAQLGLTFPERVLASLQARSSTYTASLLLF